MSRRRIDLRPGKEWISYTKAKGRSGSAVARAVRSGKLIDLKKCNVKCSDCKSRATQYDHRDYSKPLEVSPVCASCNISRGPALTDHYRLAGISKALNTQRKKLECPNCQSKSLLARLGGRMFCRRCGQEWERNHGMAKGR